MRKRVIRWGKPLVGLFATLLGVVALTTGAHAQSHYTITDMGTLGGTTSGAFGVNDSGQVVGNAMNAGDAGNFPFLYSGGMMQDLGTFPGGVGGFARGINNSGEVVGFAFSGSYFGSHAFLYAGGTMTDLGTFAGNDPFANSFGDGINNNGDVVGGADLPESPSSHAFLYHDGVMQDLGTLGGLVSEAFAVNDSDSVVGMSFTSTERGLGPAHAFLWQNGTMTDLDTLGDSYAFGINNAGKIVGVSAVTGGTTSHAALWQNGMMTDLGTLPGTNESSATAINQAGEIVGFSEVFSGIDPHAFLYRNGTMTDLNAEIDPALGWTLAYALDLNDHGQIVGYGTINGKQHGFLLTPSAAAPEPAALALLLTGMVGMFAVRRR